MSPIKVGVREGEEGLRRLARSSNKTFVLGITDGPTDGKNLLVYRIAQSFLNQGEDGRVVPVDPSSPLFRWSPLVGL